VYCRDFADRRGFYDGGGSDYVDVDDESKSDIHSGP